MPLAPGTKLGPYEIQSPLGAGGMGEVYRARDTRLDRTVAIKILPPHLSDDATLRQRFEREAKTISRPSLSKEPEKRWQSAADLTGELQWIAEGGSQAGVAAPVVLHRKVRERLAWAAATVFVISTVTLASILVLRAPKPPPQSLRLSAELPPGVSIDRFGGADVALSPDGTRLVLEFQQSGNWRMAMRSMDQGEFVPSPGGGRGLEPFFSPDGQWLGFFADHKLKKVAVQGGEPVTLCDAPGDIEGASWGDDGYIVMAFNGGSTGLMRVSSGGGAPIQITQPSKEKGETAHIWPQVLPGSEAVLFTAYSGDNYDDANIQVVSLRTGQRKIVHSGGFFGRYLPSGHLVYLRQNTLFAAPFDLKRLAVTGSVQPAVEEVSSSNVGRGDFDFSQTGTLAYVSSKGPPFRYQIFWLDSTGQTKPLYMTPGLHENPRFSPDGKHLAFGVSASPVQGDIWVEDLERDTMSRLTHLAGRSNWPLWTPDGKSIVFASAYQAAPGIYWILADSSGEAQRLTEGNGREHPGSFSPDGKRLAYTQLNADGRREIWTVPVEGDRDHPRLGKQRHS